MSKKLYIIERAPGIPERTITRRLQSNNSIRLDDENEIVIPPGRAFRIGKRSYIIHNQGEAEPIPLDKEGNFLTSRTLHMIDNDQTLAQLDSGVRNKTAENIKNWITWGLLGLIIIIQIYTVSHLGDQLGNIWERLDWAHPLPQPAPTGTNR